MTTILYHASPEGAFLAADSARYNTATKSTAFVRKLHIVTSQVLLAGAGNSNGVLHLLGGLRGQFTADQGADMLAVAQCIRSGIKECYDRGNAERIQMGESPHPLGIYLAGFDSEGTPRIEYLEQGNGGFHSTSYTNSFGCISVDSAAAQTAAIKQYRKLASTHQSVSLDQWAILSIKDHARLFPDQVRTPVDLGIVYPNRSTFMLGNLKKPAGTPSLAVAALP